VFTALLIVHGLLAVALLGAITHQAASAWWPARKPAGSFAGRFRAVAAPSYANAIVLLYVVTAILGAIIYAEYRIVVREVLEQLEAWPQNGAFELKEHFAAVGLGILPAYWYYWRQPVGGMVATNAAGANATEAHAGSHARTRAVLTALLAFIVWWNFLVGHIVNNIRGFGS
jgi:hypothetical protein